MAVDDSNSLSHIGIIRRSGRYPWGSGSTPYQRSKDFQAYIAEIKAANPGITATQIAEGIGLLLQSQGIQETFKTTDLRATTAAATDVLLRENTATARRLTVDQGMSVNAAAKQMNVNESTVRGWLKANNETKANSIQATANVLKEQLKTKEFLDVGKGTELYMGIAETKLKSAIALLKDEGYNVWSIKLPQLGTDKLTNFKILVDEKVSWAETRMALLQGKIRTIAAQSDDGGQTFMTSKDPVGNLNLKRVQVRWAEEGGTKMDGVIEVRRGVADLDLGLNKYAQVRIAVNGTHYLKGMAMYADDLPDGVDVRFNTNKAASTDKLSAMKPLKNDVDNPFGATTRPHLYLDANGKTKVSLMNMVNEEGDWDDWSKSLSSQMLSKQSVNLAYDQLSTARKAKEEDLKTIKALTNPVVRRKLLEEFADDADSSAVHLKAAALKGQSTNVILPMNSMRPDQIYAPKYENGTKVVLVRYPHGGPFEIPELTVNNNNRTAKRLMGDARDAVGIHFSKAEQLSGADFDGDTVLVIPNDTRKVKNRPPLEELKNFDAKAEYKIADDDTTTVRMTKANTQTEMGKISNLITDMSIGRATDYEIARAVKHSMVVIDAEKHGLDYKRSALDNNITELKRSYQGGPRAGAATLISRASKSDSVPQRKQLSGNAGVDPKTGAKVFMDTGRSYQREVLDSQGKRTGRFETVYNTTKGTAMEFTTDARSLLSGDPSTPLSKRGTPMERVYADHANSMKSLANDARRTAVAIKPPRQSSAAKKIYAEEIKSLDAKLKEAQKNAPLERRAQAIGNATARARIDANPGYDKDEIKRANYKALEDARILTGANKKRIGSPETPLLQREWDAVQAGAISATKLRSILSNADMERVRELATPRARTALTPGQMARARQMAAQGKSPTAIAERLGLPRSTVVDNLEAL